MLKVKETLEMTQRYRGAYFTQEIVRISVKLVKNSQSCSKRVNGNVQRGQIIRVLVNISKKLGLLPECRRELLNDSKQMLIRFTFYEDNSGSCMADNLIDWSQKTSSKKIS